MRTKRNRRLRLDFLEARRLLAVYSASPEIPDGTDGSLRAALVATQSGGHDDTIQLTEGIYRINAGDLRVEEVGSRLEISGAGKDTTVILIEGDSRFLDIDFGARVDLSGVTVLGGSASEGGQIRSAGQLSITDAVFHGGEALLGGAIFNGGVMEINEVEFWQNDAAWGGAIWNHAGARIQGTGLVFVSNTSTSPSSGEPEDLVELGIVPPPIAGTMEHFFNRPGGAAIFNAGQFESHGLVVAQNRAERGAIVTNFGLDAKMELEETHLYFNTAPGHSIVANLDGELTIVASALFENSGGNGVLANHNGIADLYAVSLFDNLVSGFGTVSSIGHLRMENVSIVNNRADSNEAFSSEWARSFTAGLFVANQSRSTTELTGVLIDGNTQQSAMSPGTVAFPRERTRPSNAIILNGTLVSGGGNRFGQSTEIANKVTSISDSSKAADLYLDDIAGSDQSASFELLEPGTYDGVVGVAPAGTSRLVDLLPTTSRSIDGNGDGIAEADAGAIEFNPVLTHPDALPVPFRGHRTLDEDTSAVVTFDNSIDTDAALGSLLREPSGQWSYTPPVDFFGFDRLVTQSASGAISVEIIQVAPDADSPHAQNDSFVVIGRSEMRIDSNATDADDSNSTADRNITRTKLDVLRNDTAGPDGNRSLRVVDVSEPQHGSVAQLHYSPDPGFVGVDSFTYTAINASGLTSTATVQVEVLDPQQLSPVAQLVAHFVDADSNPIEQIFVGETFFVELEIALLADQFEPVPNAGFLNNATAGVRIEGTMVEIAESYLEDTDNGPREVPVQPKSMLPGGLDYYPASQSANQLDESTLEFRATVGAIGGVRQGRFYRIPMVANAAGPVSITFDAALGDFVQLAGYGPLPHDVVVSKGAEIDVITVDGNELTPEDVNGDQQVTAQDALIIINSLSRMTAGEGDSIRQSAFQLDVDGNGTLTVRDALRVINYLGRQQLSARSSLAASTQASGELVTPASRPLQPNYAGEPSLIKTTPIARPTDKVFSTWAMQPSFDADSYDNKAPENNTEFSDQENQAARAGLTLLSEATRQL
ncbi:Ig-like domain-containing protein [Roseiconus lacunae]|uniref:Ig-like domain-containing protein n=1 Tax=Roseiconus lacunae TaxID=2605694 RepID=UPI0011F1577B|nr:dockerin type I domain-containing protein [Roseiconus lacunae]